MGAPGRLGGMRKALFALCSAAIVAVVIAAMAGPALAGVGYQVTVESPYAGSDGVAEARGSTEIRVSVSGGVGDAEHAAYHVRTGGGWSPSASADLPRTGERRFATTWDTVGLSNGDYQLETRVWGELPAYDPNDPATFASSTVALKIDNPPPVPGQLRLSGSAGALRVGWTPVATADRDDFLGYRVWVRGGSGCPEDLAAYPAPFHTEGSAYGTAGVSPGVYCVRIAAVRRSAVSGEILSAMSAPATIRMREEGTSTGGVAGGEGKGSASTGGSGGGYSLNSLSGAPPPPPPLLGGDVIVADGIYGERLPYSAKRIRQLAAARAAQAEASGEGELGPDPRTGPVAIATGLLMAVIALHLRGFLRRRPETA